MENKKKCSGIMCPIQYDKIHVSECKCVDVCNWYTPVPDFNKMEAVIDIAAKVFGIESDSDKAKLKMLFDVYAAQYMDRYCSI